ncbi:MAG: HNH endonuclease [Proteobacteria bacterium]|nr:HNH endonuclease [Pseudomonadota bacterium]
MNWNEVFSYCDGKLYWKEKGMGRQMHKPAGSLRQDGYHNISIGKKKYRTHRVIWELFNGPIPVGYLIDHIDSDPTNNRIENLRLATPSQNGTRSFSNARSGWKGVELVASGRCRASLQLGDVTLVLGMFNDAADAALMYNFVAAEWYGQFARFNEAEQSWIEKGNEVTDCSK